MKVWKLIAHHATPDLAVAWSIESGRIAVGWANIGDLRELRCEGAREISARIRAEYPEDSNSHTGGPSLWNFFYEMKIGDLVIVSAKGRRYHVAEVTGPYIWVSTADSFDSDYLHQRAVVMTGDDPDELWSSFGSKVADGENLRWTVALCTTVSSDTSETTASPRYSEGTKFDIVATVKERDVRARNACIRHYGYDCAACGLNFEEKYGSLGGGVIHVHHKDPLASAEGERIINPISDLIPLCPNCHAMVHRCNPPMDVEKLRDILQERERRITPRSTGRPTH